MDPNEALRALREAITTFRATPDEEEAMDAARQGLDAAEALDQWLSKGGFLPAEWAERTADAKDHSIRSARSERWNGESEGYGACGVHGCRECT